MEHSPRELILIDLNTFSAQQKLEELIRYIKNKNPHLKIRYSFSFSQLRKADVVIVATNSSTSIIGSMHLKRGAIVIDDSFPKNVPQQILRRRNDIILLEGGIMQLPPPIDIFLSRNMPDLMDLPLTRAMSCKETYGCFAELLVLALLGFRRNYCLGSADPVLARDILTKAQKLFFSQAPLQCFDAVVEQERFERISKIIEKRKWQRRF
jgi:predicted amino acid dehydrogenase